MSPPRRRGSEAGGAPRVRVFHEAGQRLELRASGRHFELMFGDVPILTSAALGTERAFGALAGQLCARPAARVLIGGLGFAATLEGTLSVVGEDAEVIVVEKLATVIRLLREDLAHLAPDVLDDPRVRLVRDDVAKVIARERELDVILLDVDNGPGWASFRQNERLYGAKGLATAHQALRSGGAYAVWSGYPADPFLGHLRAAGFAATLIPLRERGRVQARAYVGKKSDRVLKGRRRGAG